MLLIRQMLLIRAKAKLSAIISADLKKAVVLPCFIAKSCKSLHRMVFNVIQFHAFVKGFFQKIWKKIIQKNAPRTRCVVFLKMAVGDGLHSLRSRTSLRAVEPDASTQRHFMPYTACAVISPLISNKKSTSDRDALFFWNGGGRWIRTIESIASRFTVCPL